MKNITFSADEKLIAKAREKARREKTTLNNRFREWLERYAKNKEKRAEEYEKLMDRLSNVQVSRKYTREEMNER